MIADAVQILLIVSAAIYCVHLGMFLVGLGRLRRGNNTKRFSASVIVPARNEEKNIGKCLSSLAAQSYGRENFEIIVVDDRSEDRTAGIVREFSKRYGNIRLIRVDEVPPGVAPKKNAVSLGISGSSGEIIFTTDADCVAGPGWIEGMMRYFEPGVGAVVGFTGYSRPDDVSLLSWGIQFIDFFSHTTCAAGAIGIGRPFNSNASNLAYRRSAFEDIGGFSGVFDLVSGDDDLLVQKLSSNGWKVRYSISPETFMTTGPVRGLKSFLHQRIRWASKVGSYRKDVLFFLISTFIFYLLLAFSLPISIAFPREFPVPLCAFLTKVAFDFAVIFRGTRLFNRPELLKFFPVAELIHIPYILIAAIGGHFGKFEWKGERFRKSVETGEAS